MKIKELFKICAEAVFEGYGDGEVYFDTDAKKFEYVMAKIGKAGVEKDWNPEKPYLWLQEEEK